MSTATSVGGPAGASTGSPAFPRPRTYSPKRLRHAVYSLIAVALVLVLGTLGFHAIAGLDFVDAFYFEAMLATGQGPPFPLTTTSAKLFASLMAFLSVGTVLTSVVFTLGPVAVVLWRETLERVEREARHLEDEFRRREGPR